MENNNCEGEQPSTSGAFCRCSESGIGISAVLDLAQSEYSLDTTPEAVMASACRLENENDGNDTDEDVEICFTSLMPDHRRRLYMDCKLSLPAGGRVPMRGGAEAISASPHGRISSPEIRYERLRNTAVEVRKYWRLQKLDMACPLSNCDLMFNPEQLLSHCLMHHEHIITMEMKPKEPKVLKLCGKSLPEDRGKSNCVGLMIYESGNNATRNLNLPNIYKDWECQLPVLIMLWKTSWDSMPVGPRVTHIYILWLCCPQAQTPLLVSVNIGENTPGVPRRQMIQTCQGSETLKNCDLLSDSPHFMRFTHREMKEHTEDYTLDVDLQFTILEDEGRVGPISPNPNEGTFREDDIEIELAEKENTSKEEVFIGNSEGPQAN
uniref:GH13802p n=1 Tax=Drosophila melanogaster TaxID=7227 RepID=Q95U19_DROME|nr:GH13802p [Drosophila melanogaster]